MPSYIEESKLGEAVLSAGSSIRHVHISDNSRLPAGEGHINFREILDALKRIHYDGYLTLEHSSNPDAETAISQSLGYIKNLTGAAPGITVDPTPN